MNLLYSNRSQTDQDFIKLVCNDILNHGVSTDLPESDDFCGIFIDGRDREINTLEDITSLWSFRVFSKYNYPIFCFVHNKNNFLGESGAALACKIMGRVKIIEIPQLNNLDEYTNFVIKDLYYLIPKHIKYGVHLQPDAALLRNGWEDEIINNDWVYIGSPWSHAPAIEYQNSNNTWEDFYGPVRVGNGGFSIRNVEFCKAASTYCGNYKLREKFAPNDKIPPEDLFYSVIAKHLDGRVPTVEQANQFCCDPLTPEKYKSGKFHGFHYFLNK